MGILDEKTIFPRLLEGLLERDRFPFSSEAQLILLNGLRALNLRKPYKTVKKKNIMIEKIFKEKNIYESQIKEDTNEPGTFKLAELAREEGIDPAIARDKLRKMQYYAIFQLPHKQWIFPNKLKPKVRAFLVG